MLFDDFPEIHPVELVAGKDKNQIMRKSAEMQEVPTNGVRGPLLPIQTYFGLFS
jgi:hypothetical protein